MQRREPQKVGRLRYACRDVRKGRAASMAGAHTGATSTSTVSGLVEPIQMPAAVVAAHQGSLVARSRRAGVAVRPQDATSATMAGGAPAAASLFEISACSGSIRKKETRAARVVSSTGTSRSRRAMSREGSDIASAPVALARGARIKGRTQMGNAIGFIKERSDDKNVTGVFVRRSGRPRCRNRPRAASLTIPPPVVIVLAPTRSRALRRTGRGSRSSPRRGQPSPGAAGNAQPSCCCRRDHGP